MDVELEAAIDDVGRDRVFSRATLYGWEPGSTPPKHVWWGIVEEFRSENRAGNTDNKLPDPPRLVVHHYHESKPSDFFSELFGGVFFLS